MSNVFDKLIEKARHTGKRIILTETEDARVIEAANKAAELDLCNVVLLGKEDELKSNFSADALKNITFIDVTEENEKKDAYVNDLYELRKAKGMTEEQAKEALRLASHKLPVRCKIISKEEL